MLKSFFFKKSKNFGFTLIELMISVLIMAMVATIGIVAVKSSRSKSHDTKRVYDLNQYAKAFTLYSQQDAGGLFPDQGGYLGKKHTDSVNPKIERYIPNLPMDPKDSGEAPAGNYYYYYVAANDCNGDGKLVPTIHVAIMETNKPEYHNNPCPSGSTEGGADQADYLIILR